MLPRSVEPATPGAAGEGGAPKAMPAGEGRNEAALRARARAGRIVPLVGEANDLASAMPLLPPSGVDVGVLEYRVRGCES